MKYVLYSYGGENSKKKTLSLHKQFAHPSKEKMLRLIKVAGITDVELEEEIRKIEETCDTCIKFKRTLCRPVVSVPKATHFNDMISMDLKIWKEKYFLVIIDMATRYCNACIITSKAADIIIDAVMKHWGTIFGAPKTMKVNSTIINSEVCAKILTLM